MTGRLKALEWQGTSLRLLDQTKLPGKLVYIDCHTSGEVAEAIQRLSVRGAPAIGVAAAYAVVLAYRETRKTDDPENAFGAACNQLMEARPTAVNLSWAVREMQSIYQSSFKGDIETQLLHRAMAIEAEDIQTCEQIGEHGADLFAGQTDLRILTHCNTGALATTGIGTALGVITKLRDRNQLSCVYADETRPLLQGARLTATELVEGHFPCRLISDTMAAAVIRDQKIDAVITGADRIAANGDTANKIGTYGLAILAAYHHIPFYIAAPFSTFDFSIPTGASIQIEERNQEEVRTCGGVYIAPRTVPVCNPAFDVTPASLITGIITEKGVLKPPYQQSIAQYERRLHQ